MSHTCIWCDAGFGTRIELEAHVEAEHPEIRKHVHIKI
jgi:hypothetical protein